MAYFLSHFVLKKLMVNKLLRVKLNEFIKWGTSGFLTQPPAQSRVNSGDR